MRRGWMGSRYLDLAGTGSKKKTEQKNDTVVLYSVSRCKKSDGLELAAGTESGSSESSETEKTP